MSWTHRILQHLRQLRLHQFQRRQFEQDLEEEIQSHLQLETDRNIESGIPPDQARAAARKKFGPIATSKENTRQVWGWATIDRLQQDLRFAARMLRKSPGFATVAILSLALGIGANTAIFTVVYHVVLRPLPFPEPDRLVAIDEQVDREAFIRGNAPRYANVLMRQAELNSFEGVAGYQRAHAELTGAADPEEVATAWASANLAELMGVSPALGRWFSQEEVERRDPVAVLSHGLWQRQFGGNTRILGEPLTLDSYRGTETFTIIGVMPPAFHVTPHDEFDVWQPISNYSRYDSPEVWSPSYTVARLSNGVSIEQARSELSAVLQRFQESADDRNTKIIVRALAEDIVLQARAGLLVLLGAVGCVLLIACANLANLLLSRGLSRQREIAVRAALGASRRRLLMQVLAESSLLGLLGGALGIALGYGGVSALLSISFQRLPRIENIEVDTTVVAFSFALALLTGLICGVLPAWRASQTRFVPALRQGGQSAIGGRRERRVRNALVVVEIALAVVLVTGAGLFLNTFSHLQAIDLGFDPENLLMVRVRAPRDLGRDPIAHAAFYDEVLQNVRSMAGVHAASAVNYPPLSSVYMMVHLRLPGHPAREGERGRPVNVRTVSPGYFSTLEIPLLSGRVLDENDRGRALELVVVNQAMARQFWPNRDPLGQRFTLVWGRNTEKLSQVVGVVQDARQTGLTDQPEPMLYTGATRTQATDYLLIRTASNPLAFVDAVKHQIRTVDPTQPLGVIHSMDGWLAGQVAERRFYMLLLSTFGGLALLLAAVGLYGVIAYSTNRRTQEVGLRMALGANRLDVLRLIGGEGLWLTVPGVALGVAGSLALTRFLESWLYEVSPTDPLTMAGVVALLLVVAALACYVPARRATKVDPLVALRYE